MEIIELMKQRHSVRQYTNDPIENNKREILNELISDINKKANLHIQIFYDEPKCFSSLLASYGKFSDVTNYIALVGKKSSTLDETIGYYGEQIVLKAQELGLNTCWVGMTHGKSAAIIEKGEKQVCLIALGYGCTNGFAHKSKPIEKVSIYNDEMPKWFLEGIKAALLAPTALNQQKFFFELKPDGNVKILRKRGFYTKLDLGIVKYHFTAVTNKKVFDF